MLASLCIPPKPKQRRERKRRAEKDDKISPYKALFEKQPLKKNKKECKKILKSPASSVDEEWNGPIQYEESPLPTVDLQKCGSSACPVQTGHMKTAQLEIFTYALWFCSQIQYILFLKRIDAVLSWRRVLVNPFS